MQMCQDLRDVVRRQDVVDREHELESLARVLRKRVVLRERLVANSSLRKVTGPVCCGEVDVKIADDRISSRTAGALLRSRASGR